METLLPTEILEAEHRFIDKVVDVIGKRLDTQPVEVSFVVQEVEQIIDFMRIYADKCHHGKEEDLLFPALTERGVPTQGCPVGALRGDHKRGRSYVGELADGVGMLKNGDQSGFEKIEKGLEGIVSLYPNHIWKEDFLLFPMTIKVMSSDDLADLGEKFEQVDNEMGKEKIKSYESFAMGFS